MKLSVYCICKNEIKYIKYFLDKLLGELFEQDELFILDTGSDDGTLEILQKEKDPRFHYDQQIIKPWRFDAARNKAKEYIDPKCDMALSIDIDEIFEKSNWREEVEKFYETHKDVDQYFFNFIYDSFDLPKDDEIPYEQWKDNKCYQKPKLVQKVGKFHNPRLFHWIYNIHEILETIDHKDFKMDLISTIKLIHLQVAKKISRETYMKMLEESIKEYPDDPRQQFLYAREFMNMGIDHYEKAREEFKKYLVMTEKQSLNEINFDFSDIRSDRAEACHYLAEMLKFSSKDRKENINEYIRWSFMSVSENLTCRDTWMNLGIAFMMAGRKKLARQVFMMAQEFPAELNPESSGLMYDRKYISMHLLNTLK